MKTLLVIILSLLAATSLASQKAITDTGEEVILNDDGTWEYSDNTKTNIIETNTNPFIKPDNSHFLLKSKKNNSAYWINTDKWSFGKDTSSPDKEYSFQLKGKDLYGVSIAEAVQVPVESLVEIAFSNAQNAAADAKIVKKEYRIVNGKKIIYMEMNGTLKGIKFSYLGYYYSDPSGSTQFLVYTAANLVNQFRSEINDFLNGLDTQ